MNELYDKKADNIKFAKFIPPSISGLNVWPIHILINHEKITIPNAFLFESQKYWSAIIWSKIWLPATGLVGYVDPKNKYFFITDFLIINCVK